jgi:Spy/CpxP family protein refolding chaperone
MKYTLFNLAGVAALASGLVLGQGAPAQSPHRPGMHAQAGGPGMMMDRLSAELNLTDAQKQQAESIFAAAKQSAEPVRTQLQQSRQALSAAVKSGSDAEIDRVSSTMGPLLAQTTAIHSKAMAKFYAILSPEQKDKLGNRMSGMMPGFGGMHGQHPVTK